MVPGNFRLIPWPRNSAPYAARPLVLFVEYLIRVYGGGEFSPWEAAAHLFAVELCRRCCAEISLRVDIPGKDLGKLIFLVFSYFFFYLGGQPVQDFIQLSDLPLLTGLLRMIPVARFFLPLLGRVLPLS